MEEDISGEDYADSPLDAITLGVLEARSFLFKYDEDDDDEENKGRYFCDVCTFFKLVRPPTPLSIAIPHTLFFL